MADDTPNNGVSLRQQRKQRRQLLGNQPPGRYCHHCYSALFDFELRCISCDADAPDNGWPKLDELNDPWLGRVVSERYFISRPLGRGTSGDVYLAESLSISRKFAIKIIATNKDREQAEQITQRLEREIEALSRLRNPHIVSFYEFFDLAGGFVAAVMDLIEGDTLESLVLDGDPLDIDRALSVLRQISNGIYEAHQAGMIHRDLKPENLMIERLPAGDDFVHILDFGIVRLTDEQNVNLTQGFIGTPLYASPEQAQGKEVDHRSDIYSLGAILFFMLTGRPPFESDNVYKVLRQHVRTPPPKLSDVGDKDFPAPLEELTTRMLAKRADDRPDDLSQVIAQLDEIGQNRNSGSYAAVEGEKTRRTLSQSKRESQRHTPLSGIIKIPNEGPSPDDQPSEPKEKPKKEVSATDSDRQFNRDEQTSSATIQAYAQRERERNDTPAFNRNETPHSSPSVDQASPEISFHGTGDSSSAATAISSATYQLQSSPSETRASYHNGSGNFAICEQSTDELLLFEADSSLPKTLELSGFDQLHAIALANSHLYVGDANGNVVALHLDSGRENRLYQDVRRAPISTLAVDVHEKCIVAGSRSGRVYVNHRSGNAPGEWKRFRSGDPVQSVTVNDSADTIAIARRDNTVELVGISNPRVPTGKFRVDAAVHSMAISPDDYLLAAALADRSVALYQLPTGRKILSLEAEHVDVLAVEFSDDSHPVTVCSIDRQLQLLEFDQIGSPVSS